MPKLFFLIIGFLFFLNSRSQDRSPVKFGKIRASLTAQNPLMITQYKGVDPEIFNGIDNNLYPRSISLVAGVSVNFN